jgi:hypothetical protein
MLSAKYFPSRSAGGADGKLIGSESMHWDTTVFADRCAGCHTTAVDHETGAFSTISLDCVTCHGVVEIGHEKDVSMVHLSSENREPKQTVSICGQCHLRGGKSNSSGMPYANTFVAGDNLFRDFEVDWSDESIAKLPAIEQHIYLNAREVASSNQTSVTCISCHEVHADDSEIHQQLGDSAICASCHKPDTDFSELLDSITIDSKQRASNQTCDY